MKKNRLSKKKAERIRKRNRVLWIIIIMLLAFIAGCIVYVGKRYLPTKEMVDKQEYFNIKNKDDIGLVCKSEKYEDGGKIISGKPYFSYEKLAKCAGPVFFVDGEDGTLRYVTKSNFIEVKTGELSYKDNGNDNKFDEPILILENGKYYLSYKFVKEKTSLKASYYNNPNRIVLEKPEEEETLLKKDSVIRVQTGVKSPGLVKVKKGDKLFTGEKIGSWIEVRTKDGYRGYIREESLGKTKKIAKKNRQEKNLDKEKSVLLAWDIMTNDSAKKLSVDRIKSLNGINVLSPTWITLKNTSGDIISIADEDYVKQAHDKNIDVWMLASDFDFGIGGLKTQEEVETLLCSNSSRDKLTSNLIKEARKYGVDGINIDFEHIYSDRAGRGFIEFIKELSFTAKKNEIIISIDNYVPMPYNKQYYREEQGKFADYIIIMGYDEHVNSSENPGPVDSLKFVKNGIKDTVKLVPKEKVINAFPFYTRIWEKDKLRQGEKGWFKGITCGMTEIDEKIKKAGVTPVWDEENNSYYASWKGDNSYSYEVWLQDEKSFKLRLDAASDEGIIGIAGWRLGYEKPFVWEMFKNWKK